MLYSIHNIKIENYIYYIIYIIRIFYNEKIHSYHL